MKTEICYKQHTADIFVLVHDSEDASFAEAQNSAFMSVCRISVKTTFHSWLLLNHCRIKTLKLFILLLFRCVSILRCNIPTACSSKFNQYENIVLARCVSLKNTSYSFIVHFEGYPQEACTSNRLAFSRSFWNLSFIQQQHAQTAFTLFWLSHLIVSPECSPLFVTYQVHWVLEMSRDKSLTHVCYIFPKPNRFLKIELQTFQAEYIRKLWQIRFNAFRNCNRVKTGQGRTMLKK